MSPQVLVLSPPRMGTQSIADALIILGYDKVYHMREVGKNGHPQQWADLVNAKYDHPSRMLGRTDFDPLLGGYNALADFPATIFPVELIEAYPDAKVILLQRDEGAWLASMMKTFGQPKDDEHKKSPMQPLRDAYQTHCWKNDVQTHGREYWREYQQLVRQKVPADSLLEYSSTEDGTWEPLCRFLQKDIPSTPYPNRDDHREFKTA